MDINHILEELRQQRVIFHSEADFQHALAWQIHLSFPKAKIRLEYPAIINSDKIALDMLVQTRTNICGLELKYKTRKLITSIGDEKFKLEKHGACDHGRYDFLNDIKRLEDLIENGNINKGYAILLTNEYLYWKPRDKNTVDADYNIHEKRRVPAKKHLNWFQRASKGTIKNRENPIVLKNSYQLLWQDYCMINDSDGAGEFKVLVVEVK